MKIKKEELLEKIEKKYGSLSDNCGCNVSTENGWKWLSISKIVEIINDCTEYS